MMSANDLKKMEELNSSASSLFYGAEYQKSIELSDEVLKMDPKNTTASTLIAQNLDKIEKYKSIELYDDTLKHQPDNVDILQLKGSTLVDLCEFQGAIESYDQLLKIDTKDVQTLINKGLALLNLGYIQMQEADRLFDKVLEIDPKNVKVVNIKGHVLVVAEKYQDAIELYDKVLKIDPANVVALLNKGDCLRHIGEYKKAHDLDSEVLKIDPANIEAQMKTDDYFLSNSYKTNELIGTYLFFDTETTGLPQNWDTPVSELDNWPRLVQISWLIYKNGIKISSSDFIIKPNGFNIPISASNINGITTERAKREGVPLQVVLDEFDKVVEQADLIIAHNISFDEKIIHAEFIRSNKLCGLEFKRTICTMKESTNFCAIPSSSTFSDYKWPKLSELYKKLFNTELNESHNALDDVNVTAKCFWEMKKRGIL